MQKIDYTVRAKACWSVLICIFFMNLDLGAASEAKENLALITVDGLRWQIGGNDEYEQLVSKKGQQRLTDLGYSREEIGQAILVMRAAGCEAYQKLSQLPKPQNNNAPDGIDDQQRRDEVEKNFLEYLSWHIGLASKVKAREQELVIQNKKAWLKSLVVEKILGVVVLAVVGTVSCWNH